MNAATCSCTRLTTAGAALPTVVTAMPEPRSTYLYHVVDNEVTMAEYGHQCVVWQTAINPVVALELLSRGTWTGAGVLGPEAFDAVPFLDLLTEYGSPWGIKEL